MLTPASRAAVPPFHVMDLLAAASERARSHGDLLNLVAGQPSTPAPVAVREAAKRALDQHVLGYTVALGIPELREAIAGHHQRMHGLTVDPADVIVTTGSSGGFLLAFLAAFEVGDRVAIARPGYPCYRNVLTASGARWWSCPPALSRGSSRPWRCSRTWTDRCRASSSRVLRTPPAPCWSPQSLPRCPR